MTEKEKMQRHVLYDANYDEELIEERKVAKELCYDFNQLRPSDEEGQQEMLNRLLGKVGKNTCIIAPFWCDYGYNIEIGDNFFANHNLVMLDCAKIKIGHNAFIGPDCGFYTAGHPIKVSERNTGREYSKPITIGDNVWIGGGVKVMPGVVIGDNCVIGAGSVVTKDIPSNTIAMGNPCKVYRKLTEDEMK